MKTPLTRLLNRLLPAALVPWVLGVLYTVMLILVVALWARNIDPAGPYLNVLKSLGKALYTVV